MDFVELTWETVHELAIKLAKMLPLRSKLYPWPRGGLIVAGIMSHWCEHTLVTSQQLADFVVDDIFDTGKTARTQFVKKPAVLVTRKLERPGPFYTAIEIDTSNYILFPWQNAADEEEQILVKGFRTNA